LRDNYSPELLHEVFALNSEGDSKAANDRGAIKSGLTPQQIQQILDKHNDLRRNEGASNMEVLVGLTILLEFAHNQ
jgi:hypothetical protein